MDKLEDSHAEDEVESFIEEEEDDHRGSLAEKRETFRGKEKDIGDRDRPENSHQGFPGDGRYVVRER